MELKNGRRIFWFVLLSALLHSTVFFLFSRKGELCETGGDSVVQVDIVPLSADALAKLAGQIVNTSQAKPTPKPVPSPFLGRQSQQVQRQTKAVTVAPFHTAEAGGASGEQHQAVTLGRLGVKMNFKPLGAVGPGTTASTSDELKDVAAGAQTLLNTREYAYFSFYERVRERLEVYWEPGLRERIRTMAEHGRRLASESENSTQLTVVLNTEGAITRIYLTASSGLLDLDQAAVEAFNKAGPFPNPPKGLIENDGTVKIAWNFILKT